MSQRELSDKTGITEATVSRYVKGERIPKGPAIVKMAAVLDVTCDYLLGLEKCNVMVKRSLKEESDD